MASSSSAPQSLTAAGPTTTTTPASAAVSPIEIDKGALTSYLPSTVLSAVLDMHAKGRTSMPQIDSYETCVLFADVSGFTALTEALSANGPEGAEQIAKHVRPLTVSRRASLILCRCHIPDRVFTRASRLPIFICSSTRTLSSLCDLLLLKAVMFSNSRYGFLHAHCLSTDAPRVHSCSELPFPVSSAYTP